MKLSPAPTRRPLTQHSNELSAVITSLAEAMRLSSSSVTTRRKYRVPGGAAAAGLPSLCQIHFAAVRSRWLIGLGGGLGDSAPPQITRPVAKRRSVSFAGAGAVAPNRLRELLHLLVARRIIGQPGRFLRDATGVNTVAPASTSSLILRNSAGVIVSTCGNTSTR